MSRMSAELDHLRAVTTETTRFRDLLAAADPDAPVPTCPARTSCPPPDP